MATRKSAAKLTQDEREAFLRALLLLKHRPTANGPDGFSVYDSFVALHGAVMAVRVPGSAAPVNFGHGNPGFCPWHREYILRFERALQAEVPGVALPYWDWADHLGAEQQIFVTDFLGPLIRGGPSPLPPGPLGADGPTPRPAYWPAGALGFRIHPLLQEIATGGPEQRATRHRGSSGETWPPTPAEIETLVTMDVSVRSSHRFWAFWNTLEAGSRAVVRTHNAAHRFVGGHMAGAFSPNDPIFWLHHANVDRLWARWQVNMKNAHAGTTDADHYPPQGDHDPFGGEALPAGHNVDDVMWPWVGAAAEYGPIEASYAPLVPSYGAEPPRRVRDVLRIEDLGYDYG